MFPQVKFPVPMALSWPMAKIPHEGRRFTPPEKVLLPLRVKVFGTAEVAPEG